VASLRGLVVEKGAHVLDLWTVYCSSSVASYIAIMGTSKRQRFLLELNNSYIFRLVLTTMSAVNEIEHLLVQW
jgi:hypothetical protein